MIQTKPIRVAIVDDWCIVRAGLGSFLRATHDLHLVGEASDGEETLQLCSLVQPDVILLDLEMPDIDSITLIDAIHQQWPLIKILALASDKDDKLVEKVLQAGAKWRIV